VKVPDNEGVANHIVPESCAACREARSEALTGVHIGQPLSRERILVHQGADAVTQAEGNTYRRDIASVSTALRGLRTWHVCTLLVREPGDLQPDHTLMMARTGKARSRSR